MTPESDAPAQPQQATEDDPIEAKVRAVVEQAPPLSDEQRAKLATLLSGRLGA
jgi:hypothetical protein